MASGSSFDFNALQQALNDPVIRQMAEQIASDPTFKLVSKTLEKEFGSMMEPVPAGQSPCEADLEPATYMNRMVDKFEDPAFLAAAKKLGENIIDADPHMEAMLQSMKDPHYKVKVETAMRELKADPELSPVLDDLERSGPMAMIKYWSDPEMLSKLGRAMGGTFDFVGLGDLPEEAQQEEDDGLHAAASNGDINGLRACLEAGLDVNEQDEEGRTALHFACGYGELACTQVLLEAGADFNLIDQNQNTALHYAAGYGKAVTVSALVAAGADGALLNVEGKTALEIALLNKQQDVILALSGSQ